MPFTIDQVVTPIVDRPSHLPLCPGIRCLVSEVSSRQLRVRDPGGNTWSCRPSDFEAVDLSAIVRSETDPYIPGDVLEVTTRNPGGFILSVGDRVTVNYMANPWSVNITIASGLKISLDIVNVRPVDTSIPTATPPVSRGDLIEITAPNANGSRTNVGDTAIVQNVYANEGIVTARMTQSDAVYDFRFGLDFKPIEPHNHGITDPNPFSVGDWVDGAPPQRVTSINGAYVRVANQQSGVLFTQLTKIDDPYPVHVGDLVLLYGGYDPWEVENVEDKDIFLRSTLNPGMFLDAPVTIDDLSIIPRPEPEKPPTYYTNTDSEPKAGDVLRSNLGEMAYIANNPGGPDLQVTVMEASGRTLRYNLNDQGTSFTRGSRTERILIARDGVPFGTAPEGSNP